MLIWLFLNELPGVDIGHEFDIDMFQHLPKRNFEFENDVHLREQRRCYQKEEEEEKTLKNISNNSISRIKR